MHGRRKKKKKKKKKKKYSCMIIMSVFIISLFQEAIGLYLDFSLKFLHDQLYKRAYSFKFIF